MEKPAISQLPIITSADNGKATNGADIHETDFKNIFQVSPDSPDLVSFDESDSDDISDELPDDKKKIEDIKCDSPELPDGIADIPPELDPRVNHFDYINSPDQDTAERALAGDGEAQRFYAMRHQGKLFTEYLQYGFSNELERYRWRQEFKVMRNYFILSIKNRSRATADILGGSIFMNPLQKDRIDGGAWLYINKMMDLDIHKKFAVEAINVVKLTEQEKRDSLQRVKKYIDLFNLWFLRPKENSNETLKAKFEVAAGEKNAEGFIDRIPDDCLHEYLQTLEEPDKKSIDETSVTTEVMEDNETSVDHEPGSYDLALKQLQAYQMDSVEHKFVEYMSEKEKKEKASRLHTRFNGIRILLISALQSGELRALPVLIKMYLDHPREYDPLEAAAWMEIGKGVYNLSSNQEGVTDYRGLAEDEFKRITATVTRQYIMMYGLH